MITAVGNPFENTVVFGEKGSGAFVTSLSPGGEIKRLRVSSGRSYNSKYAEIDSLFNSKNNRQKCSFINSLTESTRMNVRSLGSRILSWTHLAQGRVDIVLTDAIGGYWDTLPGIVLVPEAGGGDYRHTR